MLTQIYSSCPTEITLKLVREERSGATVNDLTATWSLTDSAGAEKGSGDLVAVPGQAGDYRFVIPLAVATELVAGEHYTLRITDASSLGIDLDVVATPYRGRAS